MFEISDEIPEDQPAITALLDDGFGDRRFKKTVYRLRAAGTPVAGLSLVAHDAESKELLGTLRFWPVCVGGAAALLLGPLATHPRVKGKGVGKALVKAALNRIDEGCGLPVILIGPAAYYAPFGFEPVAAGEIAMPGPYDPARLLIRAGRNGAALKGVVLAGSMHHPRAAGVPGRNSQAIAS